MMAKISSVTVKLVELRFDKPRGGSRVAGVDIITANIADSDGAAGFGFSYVIGGGAGSLIAGIVQNLADRFLVGKTIGDPASHWTEMEKSFNRTGGGPNVIALAALDVANWDLKARREGVPLVRALGGEPGAVPVYASGGFSPDGEIEVSADLARRYAAMGFKGVKPRANANERDAAAIEAVRKAVGDDIAIMIDANEKGTIETAARLLSCAADFGVTFVEEPLPSGDPLGYRTLGALVSRAPIATGEHLQGIDRFAVAIADGYCSYVQPDLAMAGGLTPCREVARLAARAGIVVAPHFLPGLFVHLNGSFGGSMLLEEFPLIEEAFEGWPRIDDQGRIAPANEPGHGLRIRE